MKSRHGSQERRELPLRFKVGKDTWPWMVNIVDVSQNEVVRQIPTDQALEVLNRILTLIGVSVDDRC